VNKTRALSAAALALAMAGLLSCRSNHAPDVPAVPTGPDYCMKDTTYTFTTVASEPDGDSIALRFDWGDSTVSYWVGWYASGETVAFAHAWSVTGNFEVRVLAQDRRLLTSDSSEGHKVLVALRRPPDAPVKPSGPDSGGQDSSYEFQTSASHPDSMFVAIRFAWGDGDTSDWTSFWFQNAPVHMVHAWSAPGTFAVTAQAKDTGELTSLWSAPHTFVVRPRDTLLLWRVRLTTSYLTSSPAIAPDGTIYVGALDNGLCAVKPNGGVKWRYATGGEIQSSPAIAADGTVYVGSNDSCLYAVNPDGTLKWKYVTNGSIRSSPAIAFDGTVYFGAGRDGLYAMRPDGTVKWNYVIAGAGINTSPAIAADGTVYFGTDASSVYAVNPNGTERWRYVSYIGGAFASPAIGSDGAIYCGARAGRNEGFLCSLSPDGTLRWSFIVDEEISSSPAIGFDGTIFFGTTSSSGWEYIGRLHALNSDGTLKWSFDPGSPVWNSTPAINSDGMIYVGSDDLCTVYPDGTSKWLYDASGDVESSPTIGSDGTIYFTSDDGYLYALKGTSPLANSPWPKFHHDLQNTGRSDEGGWSRLRMVGAPMLSPDNSGFIVGVVNDGTIEDTVNLLEFNDTPESAYMRDFVVGADHGTGYPIPSGMPGTGPGDTVHFDEPVAIAPNGTQLVELYFVDFHLDEPGNDVRANVAGKEFVFRFDDGSVITVTP
jgi:outer membrane protein assembly factor BamB